MNPGGRFTFTCNCTSPAAGKVASARLHAPTGNVLQLAFAGFDDAESGDLQAGVDAENPQSITAVV